MKRVTIACPSCGHSEDVPEGDVPAGPEATCPRCQAKFPVTKATVVPPSAFARPAMPPQRAKSSPPPPGAGRRASAPVATARPRTRTRRKVLAAVGAAALGVMVLGATWMYVLKLTPVVTEKLLIVALYSRVPPVQRVAIKALRDYPTKHAAIALVAFINLKNLQEVPDPKKSETPDDKARRLEQRKRDLELAERATLTLCLLTGQSFGTYFKLERSGYSWGSLSEDKWPTVLWQIDTWALRIFGPSDLPLLPVVPGAPPPAEAPGEGLAR